ncbi:MAG TPA: helix-turn-helix transcriptional regulator [Mycobacteriales bacterium]|nr:helix-turn-helix transcriptional regulator [Mycobacteriales bacterium]
MPAKRQPASARTQRERLGAELRHARVLAGISGRDIAAKVRLSQSTVSRIEAGGRIPTLPEVNAWLKAVRADSELRDRLLDLTRSAFTEVETYREALDGVSHLQGRAAAMESSARTLRTFEPVIVPGLLQTAEYARRAIALSPGTVDLPAALAARLDRQQILYAPGHDFQFLLTEAALRWPAGPAEVLVAQLHRLISIATLSNVALGVLPTQHDPSAIGWHEFTIYDDVADGAPFVHTELAHVMLTINDPEDVATYRTSYDRLRQAALLDDDATAFIAKLADELSRD